MKKRYRLIKEFPGCPYKVGTVLIPSQTFANYYTPEKGASLQLFISTHVENYPEFFEDVSKAEPLFTTEDGVDIYIGDTFYYIPLHFGNSPTVGTLKASSRVRAGYARARYASKERAEKDLKEYYSAKYSVWDIKKAINKLHDLYGEHSFIEKLEDIVKRYD